MMLRFPGYLIYHPRMVERMNGFCMPRSVQPPVRSVLAWSTLSLPQASSLIPAYLICPRQEGEREIYYPAAVYALPVYLLWALLDSPAPTYVVLDSTMGVRLSIPLKTVTPGESNCLQKMAP